MSSGEKNTQQRVKFASRTSVKVDKKKQLAATARYINYQPFSMMHSQMRSNI